MTRRKLRWYTATAYNGDKWDLQASDLAAAERLATEQAKERGVALRYTMLCPCTRGGQYGHSR